MPSTPFFRSGVVDSSSSIAIRIEFFETAMDWSMQDVGNLELQCFGDERLREEMSRYCLVEDGRLLHRRELAEQIECRRTNLPANG